MRVLYQGSSIADKLRIACSVNKLMLQLWGMQEKSLGWVKKKKQEQEGAETRASLIGQSWIMGGIIIQQNLWIINEVWIFNMWEKARERERKTELLKHYMRGIQWFLSAGFQEITHTCVWRELSLYRSDYVWGWRKLWVNTNASWIQIMCKEELQPDVAFKMGGAVRFF